MTRKEKMDACQKFYQALCSALNETHDNVASCNRDISAYLIPKGTIEQLTYSSKPSRSFRISDHWNWYANINKCSRVNYIQCLSVDAPWSRKRLAPGKASKPVTAIQVCYFGADNKYHVVFGEEFNRKTKTWSWKDGSVEEAMRVMSA